MAAWAVGVTLTPTLSQRERGSMAAWAVGVTLTPTLSQRERGSMAAWAVGVTLTPTLSQRERGSEGCEAKNAPDHASCLLALYCWWLRSRAARHSGSKSRCATGSAPQWPWVSVPRSNAALAWSNNVWCTCGAMK